MGPGPGAPGRGPGDRPGGDHGGQWNGHGGNHGHYYPPNYNNGYYYYNNSPWAGVALFFGGWAFGLAAGYGGAYYSPFYDYGFPSVYSPSVVVVEQPVYTYSNVPAYDYGNGYYLSPGATSGLDQATDDIRNAWLTGNDGLILRHVDGSTQIAVYVNGAYSYSLPGTDYSNMVRDAIGHVRTTGFTITSMEKRSDGAYVLTGRHDFYDISNNLKSADVSYTLAQSGGAWVIVAVGSTESGS
jgi:hypothetical protein